MLNGCIKIITLQAKVRTVYLKPHTLGKEGIQPHNLLRNPRKERDVNSHLCILGHYEILIMCDKNSSTLLNKREVMVIIFLVKSSCFSFLELEPHIVNRNNAYY